MSKDNQMAAKPGKKPQEAKGWSAIKREETADYRVTLTTLFNDWPVLLLILLMFVAAAFVYPHLPVRVPTHWNAYGQIDGYSSRSFATFFLPLLIIWLYLMMVLMPMIDPKRRNYARFTGAYRLLRYALVVFLGGTWLITILTGLGYHLDVSVLLRGGIGLLFLLFGSVMGQIQFNYFVGVRTPWTLADERVWQTTHRFASRIWVLGSLLLLVSATVPGNLGIILFVGIASMLVLAPIIFSYMEYAGLNKNH